MGGAAERVCGHCAYCYYDPISRGSLCMIPRPPKPVERSHACQRFRPKTRQPHFRPLSPGASTGL